MQHVLAYKHLVGHAYHLVFTILVEQDYIVYIRAVGHELVLLERSTDEAFFAVDVQLFVGFHYLGSLDGIEVAELGTARIVLAILVLQHLVPVYGVAHDVSQLEVYFLDFFLDAGNVFLGLILVELQDAGHLDFHEAEDIFLSYLAHELRIVRSQAVVDVCTSGIHVLGLFEFLVLVDTFFDENLFQRSEVQGFL